MFTFLSGGYPITARMAAAGDGMTAVAAVRAILESVTTRSPVAWRGARIRSAAVMAGP